MMFMMMLILILMMMLMIIMFFWWGWKGLTGIQASHFLNASPGSDDVYDANDYVDLDLDNDKK